MRSERWMRGCIEHCWSCRFIENVSRGSMNWCGALQEFWIWCNLAGIRRELSLERTDIMV